MVIKHMHSAVKGLLREKESVVKDIWYVYIVAEVGRLLVRGLPGLQSEF